MSDAEMMEAWPLCPQLLIGAANAFYRMGQESDIHPGRTVEVMLSGVGQPPGTPWEVAFIYHVGYWSHYINSASYSSWPLPPTASVRDLGEFAKERNILRKNPELGDIALVCSATAKVFTHAGIVIDRTMHRQANGRRYVRCVTIEGNVAPGGKSRDRLVLRVTREYSPDVGDRFVRWVDLDVRDTYSGVGDDVELVAGRHVLRTGRAA
jgi:hypothetical protein